MWSENERCYRSEGERGNPTPVTISGVQRRCAIDTLPNPDAGRHEGLYGNAFARAPKEHIIAATKALMPPTISNILAMAAPACGFGDYTEQEFACILNAAFTGFSAERQESRRIAGASSRTVIHTGFLGCGAFGGDRSLMTILQAVAGDLAGVDIVFWAFDKPGLQTAHDAYQLHLRLRDDTASVSQVINELLRSRFRWENRMGTDRRPRPVCESGLALLPGYGRWHRPRPTQASSTSPRTGCVFSQLHDEPNFQRSAVSRQESYDGAYISSYTNND